MALPIDDADWYFRIALAFGWVRYDWRTAAP